MEKRTQGSPQAEVLDRFEYPDDRANAVAISENGNRIVLSRGRRLEWHDAAGKSAVEFALPCQVEQLSRDGRIVAVPRIPRPPMRRGSFTIWNSGGNASVLRSARRAACAWPTAATTCASPRDPDNDRSMPIAGAEPRTNVSGGTILGTGG